MSQELVQVQKEEEKKKEITFEELCPEWTIMMKHGLKCNYVGIKGGSPFTLSEDVPQHHFLSISKPACCVVGEAHGWSDDYTSKKLCDDCVSFSNRFCFKEYWDALRPEFAAHWNQAHML